MSPPSSATSTVAAGRDGDVVDAGEDGILVAVVVVDDADRLAAVSYAQTRLSYLVAK